MEDDRVPPKGRHVLDYVPLIGLSVTAAAIVWYAGQADQVMKTANADNIRQDAAIAGIERRLNATEALQSQTDHNIRDIKSNLCWLIRRAHGFCTVNGEVPNE